MDDLTLKQQKVWEYICQHQAEQGVPPTRAETALALGFKSVNSAEQNLRALERKGYLEMPKGRSRNLRLLVAIEAEPPNLGLPLIGRVAAGSPILAVENIETHFDCTSLFSPAADYLLRVEGDSMKDANIFDGDLLGVHKTPEARDGQIIVARVDDDVTVKRFEKRRGRLRLLPENTDYKPIVVDPRQHSFAIEGIAVGTIRQLR